MKHILLFSFFLVLTSNLFSQTEQLEILNLDRKFKAGEFDGIEYKALAKQWREVISSIGGYPELPYDSINKQISFESIKGLTGIDKKSIFNRIKEYSAITFGTLESVLQYSDLESGKIIIKGWFDVTHKVDVNNFWGNEKEVIQSKKCYFTEVFTIKDSKVKIQISNIRYEYTVGGYASGSYYIPLRNVDFSIHNLYPITDNIKQNWKSDLDILKQTTIKINYLTQSLTNYILGKDKDYGF